MKLAITFSLILAGLFSASISRGGIASVTFQADGDGNILCNNPSIIISADKFSADIQLVGDLYKAPAHLIGGVTTDVPGDPTINLSNSINNDTGFSWTSFIVNVYMNQSFSFGPIAVTTPADWTVSTPVFSLNTNPEFFSGTGTMGSFTLSAGTPINIAAPGNQLDFHYSISFQGAMNFAQEMIPVPEPSSLAVLLIGSFLFLRRPLRKA